VPRPFVRDRDIVAEVLGSGCTTRMMERSGRPA
jgi:hypothetical protein